MKPIQFDSKIAFRVFGLAAALVLAFTAAVAPAYADEGAGGAQTAGGGQRLEKIYAREQEWLEMQAERLSHTGEFAAKVQAFIDEQKAKGKDIAALEAALAAYNQQVAEAQDLHNTAAGLLAAHAGFDENGQVTDPEQALQTVREAGQALRDARQTLNRARHDLLKALRDYRRANRPQNQNSTP
jgi:hypothetical protein